MFPFSAADRKVYYTYEDYLKSDLWQIIKQDYYDHKGKVCRICKDAAKPVDLHHKHYTTLGREMRGDLVALCRDCHHTIHATGKKLKTLRNKAKRARRKTSLENRNTQTQTGVSG